MNILLFFIYLSLAIVLTNLVLFIMFLLICIVICPEEG